MTKLLARGKGFLPPVLVWRTAMILSLAVASTSQAIIIAEYDSGVGAPLSPMLQGWSTGDITEAGDPAPVLSTGVNTPSSAAANAGPGATGWIIRDYIDGVSSADRPEYKQSLTTTDFNLLQNNGWKFTSTFKMDSVTFGQEMRLLSLDQGGGQYLPFDIKVNLRYLDSNDANSNLALRIPIEDGSGTGAIITFDTGVPAAQFNTIVLEDANGDSAFSIAINGTPLMNTVDSSFLFDSTPSDGDVPGNDIIVFGANSSGGDGGGIEYDLVRLEAFDAPLVTTLRIDRDSGNVSLINTTSTARQIIGYSIVSEDGALNSGDGTWTSITENWDANSGVTPGNGSVDSNDEWLELTGSGVRTDLSEFEPDGDGANFVGSQTINLGDAWIKNPSEENLVAELLLFNGSTETVAVEFIGGPAGSAYVFGDLDFDGDFNAVDFTGTFVSGFGADTTGFSSVERYQAGDFNEDNIVDEFDFLIYNAAYLDANPGAVALSFAVPEPSAWALILVASMGCFLLRGSRRQQQLLHSSIPVLAAAVILVTTSQAQAANPIAHWKLDEGVSSSTAIDSTTNGHTGTASGTANSGAAGIIGNAWDFGGGNEDFISITTAPGTLTGLGDTFSISGWVKTNDSNNGTLFSISDNTMPSSEVLLRATSDEGAGGFGSADLLGRPGLGAGQAVSTTKLNNNQWHFLSFAQNNTGWSLYVDGVQEDTGVVADGLASPIGISANAIHIGANEDSGGTQWGLNGLIDDVAVWDGRLTTNEVQNLHLAGLHGVDASTLFTAQLALEVQENTGSITLMNESGFDFEIDLYRIRSAGDSLTPGTWNSLDSLGYDSNVWTALASDTEKVSEGAFGGESTLFIDAVIPISLGNLYDESVDAKDLIFEYHVVGTPLTTLYEGDVSYVNGSLLGDYNGNGFVDAADYTVWRDSYNSTTELAADGNGDGTVNDQDYNVWVANFGSSSSTASSTTSVPEPNSLCLVLVCLLLGIFGMRRRVQPAYRFAPVALLAVACVGSFSGVANANITVDRQYRLGDDAGEGAVVSNVIGSASSNSATWDSAGSVSAEFQDLIVNGNPIYIGVGAGDAHARPGAAGGALGASFDGSGDYLSTPINFSVPSDVWDDANFFPPGSEFPVNYEGINVQGMQMWVKPNGSTQNMRQDIIKNTGEHGISITSSNTWGLVADVPTPLDSGAPVAFDQWSHIMQISGIKNLPDGGSQSGGALFVNGVIVKARIAGYEYKPAQTFTIGAMQLNSDLNGATPSTPEHFYHGLVDDVDIFLWGANAPGTDYGSFNAGTDNEWIATQLVGIDLADINLDGNVSGDGTGLAANDDVTALIENWLTVQEIDGIQLGDWNSRANGDLNFDGITDLKDAFLLRQGLSVSGLGSLDFSLLGATVPEPTSAILGLMAVGISFAFPRGRIRNNR